MRRRWVVMRCWAGVASTMGPVPTRLRCWTRRGAERTAERMTARSKWGGWYEAARNDGSTSSGPASSKLGDAPETDRTANEEGGPVGP